MEAMTMQWYQVGTIVLSNLALFLWAVRQGRTDFHQSLRMIETIQKDSKDFHGRLERQDAEFKGRLEKQDAEYKGRLEKQDAEFKAYVMYMHREK